MRAYAKWMALSVSEVSFLSDDEWAHYVDGGCLCHAYDAGECTCGAWSKEAK
jgi:hypothetical protein